MTKYAILGVEGPHDQAFVSKILKTLLGFKDFRGKEYKGLEENLDPFWKMFIPSYPNKGNLYKRLDMPSILYNDSISVAVYQGEGSNLVDNLDTFICDHLPYQKELEAFGIIADADDQTLDSVVKLYADRFRNYYPNFPDRPGVIHQDSPRTGIYILPDNESPGVLDTLLCDCGKVVYPEYMQRAQTYLDQFSKEERESLKWKTFDRQKALVATVVSVLKPGKTNTVSIADNDWVSNQTQKNVPQIEKIVNFLQELLDLTE